MNRARPFSLAILAATHLIGATSFADEKACSGAHVQAQVLRRDHPQRLVERQSALQECAAAACPRSIQNDCAAWLRELSNSVPSLTVTVTSANGAIVARPHLTLDGEHAELGIPIEVDPGDHRVRVEADGFAPAERILSVDGHDGERRVGVVLAPKQPSGKSMIDNSEGSVPVASWTAFGSSAVGLVGLGVGLFEALKFDGRLQSGCDVGTRLCPNSPALRTDYEDRNVARTIAVVGGAVAVVGVGVGAVFILARTTPGGRSVALGVTLRGMTIGGTFK